MRHWISRLRRYLITGLIVIAPIGVTVFVLQWLFQRLDPIIGRHLPAIDGYRPPGFGLLALLVILVVVGWASQKALGRRLLHVWNRLLSRLPVARRIYGGSAQIVSAVLEREEKLFRRCVLIEYPSPGSWSLAFETAPAPGEVTTAIGEPAVSVFLPTVPNPTSGYLLILPRTRVRPLGMSVEDGFKMVLSAGVAVPERRTAAARGEGEGGDA